MIVEMLKIKKKKSKLKGKLEAVFQKIEQRDKERRGKSRDPFWKEETEK